MSDSYSNKDEARRPIRRSLWRGLLKRYPNCGEALGHIRTDDFAPWLTILLLGHVLVPTIGIIDYVLAPPLWIILLCVVWVGIISTLALLPHSKGLCLGLMLGASHARR